MVYGNQNFMKTVKTYLPIRSKFYLLFISILILASKEGNSQIPLAKGFQCNISEDHYRFDFFTDGTFKFHAEAWGREVDEPAAMKEFIESNFENKIKFNKTKDNLYWGTGRINGQYFYVIIVPESLVTVSVSSVVNNTQFSNYSSWLLQQFRNNRRSVKDYYFTNYLGKSCRG